MLPQHSHLNPLHFPKPKEVMMGQRRQQRNCDYVVNPYSLFGFFVLIFEFWNLLFIAESLAQNAAGFCHTISNKDLNVGMDFLACLRLDSYCYCTYLLLFVLPSCWLPSLNSPFLLVDKNSFFCPTFNISLLTAVVICTADHS